MARKISTKGLKEKAWATISRYVRQRDKGVCITCGRKKDWKEQDCGHFLRNTERNAQLGGNALWFDERNLACQCFYCNRMQSGQGAIYAVRIQERYGDDIPKLLLKLWQTPKKWSKEEIIQITEKYEGQIF